MKEQVRTGHLVYIIIIAIIILSFFLVIAFGGSENASTTMGTASTVSSLILSVIAIVLSLIDVAGQRQSVIDLKETAESLAVSNTHAQNLLEEVTQKLEDINTLRDILINQSNENAEWRKEISSYIQKLDETGDVSKIKSDLESKLKSEPKVPLVKLSLNTAKLKTDNIFQIKNFINLEYNPGEGENLTILVNKIGQELGLPNVEIHKAITELQKQGFLNIYPGGHVGFTNY
jgi:hypothetical protein